MPTVWAPIQTGQLVNWVNNSSVVVPWTNTSGLVVAWAKDASSTWTPVNTV